MREKRTATTRHKIHQAIVLCILCLFVADFSVFAAESDSNRNAPAASTPDLELLSRGKRVFPTVWNAYRPIALPPIDRSNGPKVSNYIKQGKLSLSLSEFMQLVVENNLTLQAARYNYLIAQVDLLRARSGQAARGVPAV